MELASTVSRETGTPLLNIMLLRHSNADVEQLCRLGVPLEEYTLIQPIYRGYDLLKEPPVRVLVAIAEDAVFQVYRIDGVAEEGTTYTLVRPEMRQFDIDAGRRELPARRYKATELTTSVDGKAVVGWVAKRVPYARFGDKLFHLVRVS